MRRFQRLGRLALALGVLTVGIAAQAQDFGRGNPKPRLLIEPHRDDLQTLSEAKEAISRKQFQPAVQGLQRLLDKPEDCFVEEDFDETHAAKGGIRKEAMRLLTSMPVEGHAAYELEYGSKARQLLSNSMEIDDLDGIAQVARHFAVTSAGLEAITLLAAHASDQHRPLEAALLIEPLRYHPNRTPQTSLLRAVYWTRAGRIERGVAALRDVRRLIPSGVMRIGGRDVTLPINDEAAIAWLQSFTGKPPMQEQVSEWMMAGGEPDRNASATAASPVGGNIWRVSTLEHLTLDGRPDEDRRHQAAFREVLTRIHQSLIEENRPILPAAQPLVIGDTVVYRTIGDVTAVSLRTGELQWRSSVVDESLVRLMNSRSLESRLRTARGMALEAHLERRTYRDNAAGTLSSDGKTVFALEELEASASFSMNALGLFSETRPVNKLVGYDLAGGRMLWEVGGARGSLPAELSAQFFLGPPLPVNDRLYVLSEAQGAMQLLVLKQDDHRQSVELEWSQTLVPTDPPLTLSPLRRLSGLSPSYADGILICPTSSGFVVAIDVPRRLLLWGFQYKSAVRSGLQNAVFQGRSQQEIQLEESDKTNRWMDGPVLIADGKVLVTPRDSNYIFCLDLVDGHELWKMQREDWMYIAGVVDDRVVLVGRHGVGAIRLPDGTALDTFAETEVEPSGRGVRVDSTYFLPTTSGEIATIDLRNGRIVARSKLADGLVPGNLAAAGGAIVSLSASDLVGFARLGSIERQIADELAANPADPKALALRGELRLHRGEEALGLADLRASIKQKVDPHVKTVLAAALLASVRAEPARIREHASELEAITEDPQQKNEFLRIYSRALEATGDRRGAFAQIIRLAQTAQFLDDLEPIEAGYSARTGRSIRARLIDMYAAASAEERAEMDRALEQHIRTSASATGVDLSTRLMRCLRFFSGLPKAEALLLNLALEAPDRDQYEELFRTLMRSGDIGIAAHATAVRCNDLINSDEWLEAAPLVRRLQTEFAEQVCLGTKTGRSLAMQWSSRDELHPFMATTAVWPTGPVDVRRISRASPVQQTNIPAEILSVTGTPLMGWSFETDLMGSSLMARDASGVARWKLALPTDADYMEPDFRTTPCMIHIRDNWMVVSRSSYFLVVDASSSTVPRVAWHQSLRTTTEIAQQQQQQLIVGGRRINNRFSSAGFPVRSGQVLGITRETVIYVVGSKLRACELESGRLAWARQDVISGQIEGSVDDQAVVIQSDGMTLLRTLDGARIGKRTQLPGPSIWSRGAQWLVVRSRQDRAIYELRDNIRDVALWTRECPTDTLATVIDDTDVAFLESSGQMVVVRLADGHERYRVELPLKVGSRDKSWFTIQRSGDRDLIMGGQAYSFRTTSQVAPFVAAPGLRATVAFDGYVCGVSNSDGKLQWATPVEKAAFDRTQPSSLPLLLLATRQFDPRANGNPFQQRYRMTARILDKRTGQEIYSTEEIAPPVPPRFEPDPDRGRIVADFNEWQLDLTLRDASKPVP